MHTYHRFLSNYERNVKMGKLGYSPSTEDILDLMEVIFKEPRSVLKEVIGAWDGTPESLGEEW